MPTRSRRMGGDAAIPLRHSGEGQGATDKSLVALGVFAAAAVSEGLGCYLTFYSTSGTYALKVYRDREQYADTLLPGDDWFTLLGDYAKQLGFESVYQRLFLATVGGGAPGAAESGGKKP